jgi:hypothetical protein
MRLSELVGTPVVDEAGDERGVVHDVAALQDGPVIGAFGAALRVEALIIGSRGVRARLGLSPAHVRGPALLRLVTGRSRPTEEIGWSAVLEVSPHRIVARFD